jgi:hypothetical protein
MLHLQACGAHVVPFLSSVNVSKQENTLAQFLPPLDPEEHQAAAAETRALFLWDGRPAELRETAGRCSQRAWRAEMRAGGGFCSRPGGP